MYWDTWGCSEAFDYCRESLQRAKKEYLCCECGRTIPKGIKYWYIFGICKLYGKGDVYVYRMCPACRKDWDEIIDVFGNNDYSDPCIVYSLLSVAFEEATQEGFLEENDPLVTGWTKRLLNPNQLQLFQK